MSDRKRWLITGACGAIGLQVIKRIARDDFSQVEIVATDLRELPQFLRHKNLSFYQLDIRSDELAQLIKEGEFHGIIHLASIVSPGKNSNREFEYSVDVLGTKNVLEAAQIGQVKHFILTSSGAAYGYHQDLPEWITEDCPIQGNKVFAYSWHKKCVEDLLQRSREQYPDLKQLILRPGTILGDLMKNQITDLFEKPVVIGIRGSDSPFVFIWDQDVAEIIFQGMKEGKSGIYNLAGDGKITNKELAKILKKPLIKFPSSVLKGILWSLKNLRLTQYGPDQISFLKYRPVLDNHKLKTEFAYTPRMTSKEALLRFLNPHENHVIIEENSTLTALDAFVRFERIDHLIWDAPVFGESQKKELLDWISYFDGVNMGEISIVARPNSFYDDYLKLTSRIKIISHPHAQELKKKSRIKSAHK